MYIVVAYFTEKTEYAAEVENLIHSLKKFNLPSDILGISSQGNWQANTQYKPYFIKQMLMRHYPKDILYLDADARVQQYPLLFDDANFDLGVVFRNNIELLTGTLYLSNNGRVFELVDRWFKGCFHYPSIWEQRILQFILKEKSRDLHLKVNLLPSTYCQIFDLMKDAGDPVIEQFQASRRFKK